jgi:rod shape-determining protein MreB
MAAPKAAIPKEKADEEEIKRREEELRKREEELRRKEVQIREREMKRRSETARMEGGRKTETRPGAKAGDVLYIGIDFGASRFALSTSDGIKRMTPTVVGWPKDEVARGFLRKDVVFGEDALKNRLALDIHYPMEKGIIEEDETGRGVDAAREIFDYMVTPLKESNKKTFCVIGVPAKASVSNKQTLIEVTKGVADAVMVTSEPFMVAYGANRLNNVLIVDIGSGTVDLSRVHGTMPVEEDQKTIPMGGDYINEQILKLVTEKYKDAQVTKEMAKRWKERYGTTLTPKRPINVEFPVGGIPSLFDITPQLVEACRSIVGEIAIGIKELISTFDPEFQDEMRKNVVLSGGGSQMTGLCRVLEEELDDIGVGPITVVPDPLYCGADGALKLGMDTPANYWEELMLA